MTRVLIYGCAAVCWSAGLAAEARGQSSSLYRTAASRANGQAAAAGRRTPGSDAGSWLMAPVVDTVPASTRVIEQRSLIAVPQQVPKPIKVNDFVTIIVREQKKYESDAKTDTQKKWDINSELSKWFRFYPEHRLGADRLSNGNPAVKFKWDNKLQADGEAEREDKFQTRITAKVIDVKPNGTLTLEARKAEKHDDEEIVLTLTGMCRAADVTADNTVLSSQIYDLSIAEQHVGAVRDATRRGWFPRLVDLLRPF